MYANQPKKQIINQTFLIIYNTTYIISIYYGIRYFIFLRVNRIYHVPNLTNKAKLLYQKAILNANYYIILVTISSYLRSYSIR